MNLGIDKERNDTASTVLCELEQMDITPYVKKVIFKELTSKRIIACSIALIGSAIAAASPPDTDTKHQSSSNQSSPTLVCLGDLINQFKDEKTHLNTI